MFSKDRDNTELNGGLQENLDQVVILSFIVWSKIDAHAGTCSLQTLVKKRLMLLNRASII